MSLTPISEMKAAIVAAHTPNTGSTAAKFMMDMGYPYFDYCRESVYNWTTTHSICELVFGKDYTWCGSRFFFNNEIDRAAFVNMFHHGVYDTRHEFIVLVPGWTPPRAFDADQACFERGREVGFMTPWVYDGETEPEQLNFMGAAGLNNEDQVARAVLAGFEVVDLRPCIKRLAEFHAAIVELGL